MRYEKPEISIVTPATVAIQSSHKGDNLVYDSQLEQTIGAYEADE